MKKNDILLSYDIGSFSASSLSSAATITTTTAAASSASSILIPTSKESTKIFISTGLTLDDLIDASLWAPVYKEQFTATGFVRRVKDRSPDVNIGRPTSLGKLVYVNSHELILVRYKRKAYAMQAKCMHRGGPLVDGDIEELPMDISNNSTFPEDYKSPCISCP